MTRTIRRLAPVGLAAALVLALLPASDSAAKGGLKFYDLSKAPKPKVTGKEIIAGLEEFVDKFPMRQQGTPNNRAAAEFLAAEAKKNGFKSRIIEFPGSAVPTRDKVLTVEAVKQGTVKPDEWIVFIAHYDIVPGIGATVQGAYDDGSGTNMLRFFGKAFSKIKTDRSIALLWFDGEENGLLGSAAYTQMLEDKGQKVVAGLGFDMVGIGYPARYCICIWYGQNPSDPELALPIIDYVNFKFLKYPEGDGGNTAAEGWPIGTEPHVCSCGMNPRNSDEQNFSRHGWFTMRWAGMPEARDYPGYHLPWDTVPFMELVAGGRENLEQGTENTFVSAYYTALVLDKL